MQLLLLDRAHVKMKLLGVDFAPLNVPLKRRLETFWAGFWFIMFVFGFFIVVPLFILLLFTQFWWATVLMATWIYIDKETCEKGGRPFKWFQNWVCLRYIRGYYSVQLVCDDDFSLDPKRNYLLGCFPHGVISMGPLSNIVMRASKFYELYPNVNVKLAIMNVNFFVPILREILLATDMISCSFKSLSYHLNKSEGGNVAVLIVGGAEESFYCQPCQYKFVVKNRKGFVKLALKSGAALAPVITFGENDVFEQVENSTLRKIQKYIKKYAGFAPLVFNGRGCFQYSFGVLPRRTPLITVLGKPIDIEKEDNPTKEQIDDLHARFVQELVQLFEKHKHKFVKDPHNTNLEIV